MRSITALLLAACIGSATGWAAAQAPSPSAADSQAARLHALFDADWEWAMRTFPEWATLSGDHR